MSEVWEKLSKLHGWSGKMVKPPTDAEELTKMEDLYGETGRLVAANADLKTPIWRGFQRGVFTFFCGNVS